MVIILRIGADSMGAMGTIDPRPKVVEAMPLSRPHRNFVMSPLYTAKSTVKITNVSL